MKPNLYAALWVAPLMVIGVTLLAQESKSVPGEVTFHIAKPKVTDPKPNTGKERWLTGKRLFMDNCSACHSLYEDRTGPALKGVSYRWRAAGSFKGKTGEQWMSAWIKNWHDVLDAGYQYGIYLRRSRPAEMNVFPCLRNQDIETIVFYIEWPEPGKVTRPFSDGWRYSVYPD